MELGAHLQIVGVLGGHLGVDAGVELQLLEALEHASEARLHAVDLPDELVQFALRADDRLHFIVGERLDVIERVDVDGVRHGDGQQPTLLLERRHLVLLGDIGGKHLGEVEVNGILVGVVFLDLELLAQDVHHLVLRQDALLDQELSELHPRLLLLVEKMPELVLVEDLGIDEHFPQLFADSQGLALSFLQGLTPTMPC